MSRQLVLCSSWGNDSVAMAQLLRTWWPLCDWPVTVLYCNTGWAEDDWEERVARGREWVLSLGWDHVELHTKGFEQLVLDGDAGTIRFPNGMRKTCTERLKIIPTQKWLSTNDPQKQALVLVGVRRAESKRREAAPVFIPYSELHGGRMVWQPLAEWSTESRDALVAQTPLELLPHRSDECNPCIFSTRADLKRVPAAKIDRIRALEAATGKTMFRAAAYAGAQGIDEVMRWAHSERGQFRPGEEELQEPGCEDGFCGT